MLDKLEEFITEGVEVEDTYSLRAWVGHVAAYLETVFGKDVVDGFNKLVEYRREDLNSATALRGVGMLEGLRFKTALPEKPELLSSDATAHIVGEAPTPSVFIVHGHDSELKEKTARFIERLGLSPVILHEQASQGTTIIEKLERHANVKFAIVLLTGDDIGGAMGSKDEQRSRARQNVIFELGYFIAKLGRSRVCALYAGDVELPSDYRGVVYVRIDPEGVWRTKLAQELVEAGLSIDLKALLSS